MEIRNTGTHKFTGNSGCSKSSSTTDIGSRARNRGGTYSYRAILRSRCLSYVFKRGLLTYCLHIRGTGGDKLAAKIKRSLGTGSSRATSALIRY